MLDELTAEQLAIQEPITALYPELEIRWKPLDFDREWAIDLGGYADLAKGAEYPKLDLPIDYLGDGWRRVSKQVNCELIATEFGGLGAVLTCFLLESFTMTSTGRKIKRMCYVLGKISERSRFPLDSFFLHALPGGANKFPDFDAVRRWRWRLRQGESVALIHGNWGFIPKEQRPQGVSIGESIRLEGAHISAEKILKKGDRLFALNPASYDDYINLVTLEGWHEVRRGRQWINEWDAD